MDLANMTGLRPDEIKTYHRDSYDRISLSNTTFDAKGKTLLITAGATGIGYSISESFAKAGIARIIILQRRESVLAAAKESLEKAYPNTKVETHIASQSDFPRITEVLQSVGEIDVLVPCATSDVGYDGQKPAKDVATQSMLDSYTVNVIGLFHIVREFLAIPSTLGGGPKSVIHISSCASQMVMPGGSAYCSTKAAANQIITHFGYDDPKSNVKFYSVHPGAIRTQLAIDHVKEDMVVWEDLTLPGDFAVWLASPEADFLTGRYVWAQWDVDELISMEEKLAQDPNLLTIGLVK